MSQQGGLHNNSQAGGPHLEDGYTRINNHTLDHLIKTKFNPSEYSIILAIIRKTWGFNKKKDNISISQFVELTGLSRRTVIYAIKSLEEKRIISKKYSPKGNEYTLNKYTNGWNFIQGEGGAKLGNFRDKGVQDIAHTKDTRDIPKGISKGKPLGWEYYWENFCKVMQLEEGKESNKEVSFIRLLYNNYSDVLDDALIELCEQQLGEKIKDTNHARSFLRYKCRMLADTKKVVYEPKPERKDPMEGAKVLYELPPLPKSPKRSIFGDYIKQEDKLPN